MIKHTQALVSYVGKIKSLVEKHCVNNSIGHKFKDIEVYISADSHGSSKIEIHGKAEKLGGPDLSITIGD